MKHPIYALFLIIIILITFCTENPIETIENDTQEIIDDNLNALIKIENTLNIDIGGENTEFKFKVTTVDSNDLQILSNRAVMWDFESDGIFDTEWLPSDTTKKVFSELGKHNITAKVQFDSNKVGICSLEFYSQPSTYIMPGDTNCVVHEFCYGNDEEKIFFVWCDGGGPHNVFSMERNGSNVECITCNFEQEHCRHYVASSKDGKYLAYTYEGLQLLNTETKIETQVSDIRPSYEAFSFSEDNKELLFLQTDGIHSYNLVTKKDSIILTENSVFSTVPGTNLIAFKKYQNKTASLWYYNLSTTQSELIYSNLPSSGRFQILQNENIIYFLEAHELFNLNSGNLYKISDTQFEIFESWPSSITLDGSEVLLSADRALLKITLPSDLQ